MKSLRTETKKARIEIIPMIDTIFFLLVFFMIQSLSMVQMRGVAPALPRPAAAGDSHAVGSGGAPETVLTVTAGRQFFLGHTPVVASSLEARLTELVRASAQSVVVLNLSPRLTTQDLISILDLVGRVHTASGTPLRAVIATGGATVALNARKLS